MNDNELKKLGKMGQKARSQNVAADLAEALITVSDELLRVRGLARQAFTYANGGNATATAANQHAILKLLREMVERQ